MSDCATCRIKESKVKKRWEQITLPSEFPRDVGYRGESDSGDDWLPGDPGGAGGNQATVRRSETIRSVSSQTSTSSVLSSECRLRGLS